MTPTSRTLNYLRNNGYLCDIVERFIQGARIRSDLFGIIDIIAIQKNEIIGVQSTGTAFSAHLKKIETSKNLRPWMESGAGLWLIGWRKLKKKRGGKQKIYKPRIGIFTLDPKWGILYREEK